MVLKRMLLALLATLVILPFGQTQLITTVPTPTFSATSIVTVSEESFYTNYVQGVSTFTTFETSGGTAALAVETEVVVGGIQDTDVTLSQGYIINNFSDEDYALCWYPTSGNWALLPRVLFYGTIVFALIARAHEWLVAGALAASLTFSGVAAIQMSLQVWTGQMVAELDFFALLGILSTSCIIAMPLLNWSSTIRYLGQSEQDKEARENRAQQIRESRLYANEPFEIKHEIKHETYGPTRTVIVFWALLVAVGFLSGFAALMEMRSGNSNSISIYTNSGVDSIRCVPDNGTLNLEAGQFEQWDSFWITAEFVSDNHCENPCTALPDGQWTLFRSPSKDLQVLTAKNIDDLLYQSAISHRERHALEFTGVYYKYMLFGLPFILMQGFLHFFLFRKHTPQGARQRIYLLIVGEENPIAAHPFKKGFALTLSLLFYFFAVLILFLTPFILVLNVVATELFMYIFPQSEYNKHVGQWSVAASTLLVLIAAVFCRHDAGAWYFWKQIKRAIGKSFSRWRRSWRGRKHNTCRKQSDGEADPPNLQHKNSFRPHQAFLKIFKDILGAVGNIILDVYDYFAWTAKDFVGLFTHEWTMFKFFWKNPAIIPPASFVLRDKPEMPSSRRKVTKSYDNSGSAEKFQRSPVIRYELREYPVNDGSGDGIKTYSVISEAQPMSINEIERPLLNHGQPSGSNVAIRSRQSQALSKQESIYTQITSTPQSPLLSPPIQHNGQLYRLVPSQANSPHLSTGQVDSNTATPRTHLFANIPFHTDTDPMTVTGSLTNSIAARSRRSDVYSPAPEQTQHTPPLPQQDPVSHQSSPKPDLLKNLPQTPPVYHSNPPILRPVPQTRLPPLPPLSTRTSNLLSEDEIADFYKNGTPQIRSAMPSRDGSLANFPPNSGLSAEARGINGTGRVVYLQIQSGRDLSNAEAWGDQLTLQRDRYGRWVIVDAPDAVELPAGRISEADDEDEDEDEGRNEVRPREW